MKTLLAIFFLFVFWEKADSQSDNTIAEKPGEVIVARSDTIGGKIFQIVTLTDDSTRHYPPLPYFRGKYCVDGYRFATSPELDFVAYYLEAPPKYMALFAGPVNSPNIAIAYSYNAIVDPDFPSPVGDMMNGRDIVYKGKDPSGNIIWKWDSFPADPGYVAYSAYFVRVKVLEEPKGND